MRRIDSRPSPKTTRSKLESMACKGMLAINAPSFVNRIPVATRGAFEVNERWFSVSSTFPSPENMVENCAPISPQSARRYSMLLEHPIWLKLFLSHLGDVNYPSHWRMMVQEANPRTCVGSCQCLASKKTHCFTVR